MTASLKFLALLMGVCCALIGLYHCALGQWSVPGAGPTVPTVDSRQRFFSVYFFGYGMAWIWAARRTPMQLPLMRALTGIFLLSGIARIVSWIDVGRPHWMQIAEGGIELVLPLLFFVLIRGAASRQPVGTGRDHPDHAGVARVRR